MSKQVQTIHFTQLAGFFVFVLYFFNTFSTCFPACFQHISPFFTTFFVQTPGNLGTPIPGQISSARISLHMLRSSNLPMGYGFEFDAERIQRFFFPPHRFPYAL